MKKVILGLLCVMTIFGGIGCEKENKSVVLDLEKIKAELKKATSDEFYIFGINEKIDALNVYKNLEDLYESDIEEIFSLDTSNIEQFNVRYDKDTQEFYAVLKANEGKEEVVKNQMNSYLSKQKENYKIEEYQGYLVVVLSRDNDLVLKTIKDTKMPIFGAMVEVTKEQMKETLNLDSDTVSEFLMSMPMMIVQSNTYIIAKPAEGKEEEVQNALNIYMTKLEEQWKTYLPDQYELVKNRKVEKYGDYLIYIVSSNNDLVWNTIKKAVK